MASATFSRRNLDFTLFEVLNTEQLNQYACFEAHDADTMGFTLDAATDIAEQLLRPAYTSSDRQQPNLENGQVRVHEALHAYVKTYSETGLMAATFPEEWGGMQLPRTLAAASEFIMGSAHNSFIMYTDLTKGAASLIYRFGNDAQKSYFLPRMLSGQWLGTMCLTETQAGSSLSDIATTATPQPDGSFSIKGQKIFISAGDHDITENIIHLVLARIEGAPKGTKGISLFIVPKIDFGFGQEKANADGFPHSNDVTSIGIYHKMGQKATPAMHLEFGAKGACKGYLLGEANKGLPQMFLMMNGARLGVGVGGLHIASAAYHASLQYAHERPQGRRLNEKSAQGEQTLIIRHPDVRRMLLLQKSIVEGGLSFVLQCFKYLDLEKAYADNPEKSRHYNQLLELLTPVAKTYGAEMGWQAVSQGLQVLGGYGYTEDFVLEQLLRDCRIMALYEGTTGIQSQALLGRQVLANKGESLSLWYDEVSSSLAEAENDELLGFYYKKYAGHMTQFQAVTHQLISIGEKGDMELCLADANLYMEAFGLLNVGWQWLKQALVARKALQQLSLSDANTAFYESKIHTMRFYFHYEMPRLSGLFERLTDTTALTIDDGRQIF